MTAWFTTEVLGMEPLRVTDRCDGCNAQAYVRVGLGFDDTGRGGHDLAFCGHCYHEQEPALAAAGAVVLEDKRAELTQGDTGAHA